MINNTSIGKQMHERKEEKTSKIFLLRKSDLYIWFLAVKDDSDWLLSLGPLFSVAA